MSEPNSEGALSVALNDLDDLPLLTEVVVADTTETLPADVVETLSAQLLQDETAYQQLLARLEADWAARHVDAAPRDEVSRPTEPTLDTDATASPLDARTAPPTEAATPETDERTALIAVADGFIPEADGVPTLVDAPVAITEPPCEIDLDAPLMARLEAHLAQRLEEKLAVLPVAPKEATLSEEEYERVVDRLEDHLENLLHQKLEAYLARIKPSIVAQVLEELRQDAVQLLHTPDEDGT